MTRIPLSLLASATALAALAACSGKPPGGDGGRTSRIRSTAGATHACAAGVAYSFVLEQAEGALPAKLGVPGAPVSTPDGRTRPGKIVERPLVAPKNPFNVQLDLCLDDAAEKVISIERATMGFVSHGVAGEPNDVVAVSYPYGPLWRVKGLEQALFREYGEFELFALHENAFAGEFGGGLFPIHLKGTSAGGRSFVAVHSPAGAGTPSDGDEEKSLRAALKRGDDVWARLAAAGTQLGYVLAGELAPGGLRTDGRCMAFEKLVKSEFSLGTARFAMESCRYESMDVTPLRVVALTVSDDNPALRGGPFKRALTERELATAITVGTVHHYGVVGLRVALPEATYLAQERSFTTAVDSRVPDMFTEAEAGLDPDEEIMAPVIYKVRYGDGAWSARLKTDFWQLAPMPRDGDGDGGRTGGSDGEDNDGAGKPAPEGAVG